MDVITEHRELVDWILDDSALLATLVRLCSSGTLGASNETLKTHPWDKLVPAGLATVKPSLEGKLVLHRWLVAPTALAREIYKVHLIEETLQDPFFKYEPEETDA